MQAGLAIAGRLTARYLSNGPGLFGMQIGLPPAAASPGQGDVEALTSPVVRLRLVSTHVTDPRRFRGGKGPGAPRSIGLWHSETPASSRSMTRGE